MKLFENDSIFCQSNLVNMVRQTVPIMLQSLNLSNESFQVVSTHIYESMPYPIEFAAPKVCLYICEFMSELEVR